MLATYSLMPPRTPVPCVAASAALLKLPSALRGWLMLVTAMTL